MRKSSLPIEIPESERTPLVNWLVNKRHRAATDNREATGDNRKAATNNCQTRRKTQ
ncbi:MAG: hypothetical protein QNJ72_27105 [Pleurocapsa sp. MO_226.B13]|nr:hypothetical protein [Pleurocapsa sp. MO_226.B13]